MDCKSVIDRVVEARDLEDRRVGSIISTLRPKVLANIDSGSILMCWPSIETKMNPRP